MTTGLLTEAIETPTPKFVHAIRTSSARIRPDSGWIVYVLAPFVGVILIAAFTVSFERQITVAQWEGLREGQRLAVPAAIDSVIIVFTVAAVVLRARGKSPQFPWLVVGALTVVSMSFIVLRVLVPASAGGITRRMSSVPLSAD